MSLPAYSASLASTLFPFAEPKKLLKAGLQLWHGGLTFATARTCRRLIHACRKSCSDSDAGGAYVTRDPVSGSWWLCTQHLLLAFHLPRPGIGVFRLTIRLDKKSLVGCRALPSMAFCSRRTRSAPESMMLFQSRRSELSNMPRSAFAKLFKETSSFRFASQVHSHELRPSIRSPSG